MPPSRISFDRMLGRKCLHAEVCRDTRPAQQRPHHAARRRSLMLVTALSPVIGYDKASAIAHRKPRHHGRSVLGQPWPTKPRDGRCRCAPLKGDRSALMTALERLRYHLPDSTLSVAALRSSTVSMGFGYMRRRCTSNAKHSSATSFGRERDRPVCFSIRRNRWRTVFG